MFTLLETKVTIEGNTLNTYGIKRNNLRVADISTDKAKVSNFINILNETGDVADCHVVNLIEDFFF